MRIIAVIFALSALALGCEKTVGEFCEVSGDGFTRRDPCEHVCMNWELTCPDGQRITPNECAGAPCGQDGVCPDGLVCLQIDSVPANARCVAADLCAAPEA